MGATVLNGSLGSDTNRPFLDPGTSIRSVSLIPGPSACDASATSRIQDVAKSWQIAAGNYVLPEIARQTSKEFLEVISALLPSLLLSLGVVATTTALGAIAGGIVGAGAGAVPGAVAGFSLGLTILEFLGIGFLAVYLTTRLGEVDSKFRSGLELAWKACGNPVALDTAAREFAGAIGLFFSTLMQGVVAFAAKEGFGAASEKLNASRLGRALVPWLQEARWNDNPKIWLADIGNPLAPPLLQKRMTVALEFLRNRKFGYDDLPFRQSLPGSQLNRLKSIDFHNAVEVIIIRTGEEVIQYQNTSGVMGNYLSKVGTSAENLAMDTTGRPFVRYRAIQDTTALKSTAAEFKSGPGEPSFAGRGIQYLIDNDSRINFVVVPKPKTPTP